jgi:simple sugar transport system permease protein
MSVFKKLSTWEPFLSALIGLTLALGTGTLLLVCLGENTSVLWEALFNACCTDFGLGYTLFYTTPYLFTGLAVAICFQCGLFNIGCEGQLYLGAISIVWVSQVFPHAPAVLAIPIGIAASVLGGGLWGGLAGWLKAKRGSHEVIVTILLNFLGIALANYLILYPLDNPVGQNPETIEIPAAYFLPSLHQFFGWFGVPAFDSTPANTTLFLALFAAVACQFFLFHTPAGFALRSVGHNPVACQFAGISVSTQTLLALFIGGALAGCVGINEVMGYQHRVIEGFSPQYGFTGIAVALLARSHPIGIVASALLFGVLQNSARELEFLSEKVTKELAMVIQSTLIAFVAGHALWSTRLFRGKKNG